MSRLGAIRDRFTSARAQAFYYLVVTFGVAVGALYGSYVFNGLIDTIAYAVVFIFAIALIPTTIAIAGAGVPFNAALGRAHIVLGAFAFGHHYLVQREDRWEWCPGDEQQVFIDDEWKDIEGGFGNKSVLGWRPFGILRYKEDGSLRQVRADQAASKRRNGTAADGGLVDEVDDDMARGGWQQARKPTVTGRGGTWLVDLKRVYSSGIKRIGDIELIETAEEIIERGQVNDSGIGGHGPMLTFVVSLILGILVGTGVLFLG